MKKLVLAGLFLLGMSTHSLADNWKEVFKETEGQVMDWAIASSFEPGYFRDMIGGRNAVGAQFPIVYVTPYISGDIGYVTGYDSKSRGSLMVGGTLRVNRLLEDFFKGNVGAVRNTLPALDRNWDRLWLGPWIAHSFTDSELLGGIKAGLSF